VQLSYGEAEFKINPPEPSQLGCAEPGKCIDDEQRAPSTYCRVQDQPNFLNGGNIYANLQGRRVSARAAITR
jgi:hypothetical protein